MAIVLVQRAVIKTSPLISNWSISLFCAQNSRLSCLFESIERSCQLFTANLREGVTNYFARVPPFWTKFATFFLTLIFGVSQGAPTDHLEKVMIFGFSRACWGGLMGSRGAIWEKMICCTSIILFNCQKVFDTTQTLPWQKVIKCSFFVTHRQTNTHTRCPKNALSELPFCETPCSSSRHHHNISTTSSTSSAAEANCRKMGYWWAAYRLMSEIWTIWPPARFWCQCSRGASTSTLP